MAVEPRRTAGRILCLAQRHHLNMSGPSTADQFKCSLHQRGAGNTRHASDQALHSLPAALQPAPLPMGQLLVQYRKQSASDGAPWAQRRPGDAAWQKPVMRRSQQSQRAWVGRTQNPGAKQFECSTTHQPDDPSQGTVQCTTCAAPQPSFEQPVGVFEKGRGNNSPGKQACSRSHTRS